MDKLLSYLNSLGKQDQESFARRCGTSVGYLRKAVSTGQQLGESLCINIDRESDSSVRFEDLRPDVDWAYVRNTQRQEAA